VKLSREIGKTTCMEFPNRLAGFININA